MLRELRLAAIILAASLLATVVAWRNQARQIELLAEQIFSRTAERLKDEIDAAMTANGQALRGGAALFHAAGRVTRQDWQRYVEKLEPQRTFPGIQGMAYATVLRTPEERAEHERSVRAEGRSDYRILPKGDRPLMAVIEFIGEIDPRYRRAEGRDVFAEPIRRQAMEQARDTGELAMSGKVVLLRDDPPGKEPEAGVVLFLPIYARDRPIDTPQQRQEALQGFVLSPFSMYELVRRVLTQGGRFDAGLAAFDIFDGVSSTPETKLYGQAEQQKGQRVPRYARTHTLELFGRHWTLRFASTPAFEADMASRSPLAILLAGLLASTLFSGLVWSMTQRQLQAIEAEHHVGEIAERKQAELALRESETLLRSATDNARVGLVVMGRDRRYLFANPAFSAILGLQDDLVGKGPAEVLAPVYQEQIAPRLDRAFAGERVSFELTRPDLAGQPHYYAVVYEPRRDEQDEVTKVIVVVYDITAPKLAEEHMRFVMRELSHRTKNLLAVVQATAMQSSQKTTDIEEFLERFTQRIESLRRSHDLLIKREWAGVVLEELVRGQLSPFLDGAAVRLSVSGPRLMVKPSGAEELGMVLHELATNASKYGSLSVPSGTIAIDWDVYAGEKGVPIFHLCWQERGGPAVVAPAQTGFGITVIKDMLATTKKARISMDFDPSGLIWRLEVDAERLFDGLLSCTGAAIRDTGSIERGTGGP